MASEVDISNLALGFLGDPGTVSSINPPEGSVQAGRCQRFYPIARDVLLERRKFSFSTKRATPAATEEQVAQWAYAYALPSETLKVQAVLPPGGSENIDDLLYEGAEFTVLTNSSSFQGQPFEMEAQADGTVVVRTNQPDATLLYTVRVTNTNKFTPMFVLGLARTLASFLAGPIIKGKAGADESMNQLKLAEAIFSEAATLDANASTSFHNRDYVPSSMRARQ